MRVCVTVFVWRESPISVFRLPIRFNADWR